MRTPEQVFYDLQDSYSVEFNNRNFYLELCCLTYIVLQKHIVLNPSRVSKIPLSDLYDYAHSTDCLTILCP